jgi:hypothetical protein
VNRYYESLLWEASLARNKREEDDSVCFEADKEGFSEALCSKKAL